MRDPRFPATVEFVNVSLDLGAFQHIYDDEALTSLRITDHDYRDVTAEIEIASGENNFYYTPTGDTSVVTLEGSFPAIKAVSATASTRSDWTGNTPQTCRSPTANRWKPWPS